MKRLLLPLIITMGLGIVVAADQVFFTPISSEGLIKYYGEILFYEDYHCQNPLNSLSWGEIPRGQSVEKHIFLHNPTNHSISLSLTGSDYNPIELKDHICLSWNRENVPIPANETYIAYIKLSIAHDITNITNFHFNLIFVEAEI